MAKLECSFDRFTKDTNISYDDPPHGTASFPLWKSIILGPVVNLLHILNSFLLWIFGVYKNNALFEMQNQKGRWDFFWKQNVRIRPVPKIDHRRSFVSELKFGTQKPRKRAIGCGFIRIRSKVFPLDGWAGWTRTIGMPQSKCGALPLGYSPI